MMLSAGLIVFKQTKNTSGKKYHGVPEGGASRTSKGATDSPACRAALGHYSSWGWAGVESGHPSFKSCHSCLKKINNPKKKVNWWATTLVGDGRVLGDVLQKFSLVVILVGKKDQQS